MAPRQLLAPMCTLLAASSSLLFMLDGAVADKASLDCPLRQIGLDYAATLQPFRPPAAFQEIADALNGAIEAANCSVAPKSQLTGAPTASRVGWAKLPSPASGVTLVYADPSKGSDTTGDGSEAKPFATIQRALRAVWTARAQLQSAGKADASRSPFTIVLRAGTFYLGSTINLDSSSSFVSFNAYPGEQVSISGAAPIKGVTWAPFKPPVRAAYETKQGCLAVQFDAAPAGIFSATKATSMCDAMPTCAGFVINAKTKVVNFKTEVFWAPAGSSKTHGGSTDCTGDNIGTVYIKNFGYSHAAAPNLFVADISGLQLGAIEGLRVNGQRMIRARYPNARTVEQMDAMQVIADGWTKQSMPKTAEYTYNPSYPTRMDSIVDAKQSEEFFSTFKLGVGGPCAQRFTPQASYWCSNTSEGGGPGPYSAPVGMTVSNANESLPHLSTWKDSFAKGAQGAIVHSWRAGRWFSWAFEVSAFNYDEESGKATFDFSLEKGGNQGSRGGDAGQEFMIENLLAGAVL